MAGFWPNPLKTIQNKTNVVLILFITVSDFLAFGCRMGRNITAAFKFFPINKLLIGYYGLKSTIKQL